VASPHIILLLAATPTADAAAFYFCKPTTEHPDPAAVNELLPAAAVNELLLISVICC